MLLRHGGARVFARATARVVVTGAVTPTRVVGRAENKGRKEGKEGERVESDHVEKDRRRR